MIKLLDQPIPNVNRKLTDLEAIWLEARNLRISINKLGDCLEVDIDPENIRKYGYGLGTRFVIRQVTYNKWRIWRVK